MLVWLSDSVIVQIYAVDMSFLLLKQLALLVSISFVDMHTLLFGVMSLMVKEKQIKLG